MFEAHFPGPQSNDDFFQQLWDFRHNFIDRYARTAQIQEATIHIQFCDDRTRPVRLRNEHGKLLYTYTSPGAYQSAADYYDPQSLEPKITTASGPPIRDVPLSPF